MRKRGRYENEGKTIGDKIILYTGIGVAIFAVIVIGLLFYSKSLNEEVKKGSLTTEQISDIMNNTSENETQNDSESASSTIGKSIEEAQNNTDTTNITSTQNVTQGNTTVNTTNTTKSTNPQNTTSTKNQNTTSNQTKTNTTQNKNTTTNSTAQNDVKEETKKQTVKELNFQKPVEGEVVREYAKDNLIYSETLKEWVTHMGIDIKADKTTVVKAAEEGTIKSIKNDPRYGLTIVIEHENGFQTVYSNLLTSEFVVENEKVEKGQSIGTVGNTAPFEIADEAHLHFEIVKDGLQVDPNIYIK